MEETETPDLGFVKPSDIKVLQGLRRKLVRAARQAPKTYAHMTVEELVERGHIPLTQKQRRFVEAVAAGMPPSHAARSAGYPEDKGHTSTNLMKQRNIQAALKIASMELAKASAMNRKKVLDGFQEAIGMAKLQGDPAVMVMAWREIGRMCGFYEATKHEVKVSVDGQVTHKAIRNLSDEELLRMADNADAVSGVIEGEYKKLPEEVSVAE